MKKPKRSRETKPVLIQKPAFRWWPWVVGFAALFLAFEVYTPALGGAFVLDDRYLPFFAPDVETKPLSAWITNIRPLLMLSFWMDYRWSGTDPYAYHVTNVVLHFLTSMLVALIAARLLEWAGVAGRARAILSVFSGALFLLHPLQTESVAYVASRSEDLSVLFYYASFAVFLYRGGESMTFLRALGVVALFGAAAATKEHTLTLPILLLLTDYFWGRGGFRKNGMLYALIAIAGAAGAALVWKVLRSADTAGFHVKDLTPVSYFLTQCRVIWTYVRLFFLPYGQNVDADIPISQGPLDHGAILALLALVAVAAAAWTFRNRYPLGAYGVFVFLLLLAPTSSFIPIRDVLAERRVYLPFLGLVCVCLEFLRRLRSSRLIWTSAALLFVCAALTYQRNQVWASPLALWRDTVSKSPSKVRPRFQLAFALYDAGKYAESAQSYEIASRLGPVDYQLLLDWALALDGAGRVNEAIDKLRQAALFERSAHVFTQMGMVYAKHGRTQEALDALAEAEKIDPRFEITYLYRGNVYESAGDRVAAAREYQRAVALNPTNQAARDALVRVSR